MFVSACAHLFVYPWYVGWIDVLMIVFLQRNGEREMETAREKTVVGWLPSLGGWWKDEGASRKDILSGLVRVWPVLGYMSLLAHLTHKHTLRALSHITLLFRSPSVSHQWPNPGRNWETNTRLFIISKDRGQLQRGNRARTKIAQPNWGCSCIHHS